MKQQNEFVPYHGRLSSASTGRLAALRLPLDAPAENVMSLEIPGPSTSISSSKSDILMNPPRVVHADNEFVRAGGSACWCWWRCDFRQAVKFGSFEDEKKVRKVMRSGCQRRVQDPDAMVN